MQKFTQVKQRTTFVFSLLVLALTSGCKGTDAPSAAQPQAPAEVPAVKGATQEEKAAPEKKLEAPSDVSSAQVGKPAPDFTLKDLQGNSTTLSTFKGKTVVLEWFNPSCPFVKAAHTKGSLVDTANDLTKRGVVYLAINSGAPGKQGHGVEVNQEGKELFNLSHPILLDEAGTVGRAYGASNTPHIYVVNAEGLLVYRGAIDNSPDGEGGSPTGGTLINYLSQAVNEVLGGKPVSVPETKAYGCSVKYGS